MTWRVNKHKLTRRVFGARLTRFALISQVTNEEPEPPDRALAQSPGIQETFAGTAHNGQLSTVRDTPLALFATTLIQYFTRDAPDAPFTRTATTILAPAPGTPSFSIIGQDKSFKHQYANMYFMRLHALRKSVEEKAKRRWSQVAGMWWFSDP